VAEAQVIFKLTNLTAKHAAIDAIMAVPEGWVVRITDATRSLDQNAKLWPMLTDIASQVEWYGKKLTEWEWKDVFTAALKKSKVVPGIDGGFVVLGQHTSSMSKSDFSELLELITAFAVDHGVKFSETEDA
jgi:hypothetical protein